MTSSLEEIKEYYKNYTDDNNYVYKSSGDYIIVLSLTEKSDTNRDRSVVDPNYARYRASTALTELIFNKFDHLKTLVSIRNMPYETELIYEVGEIAQPDGYDNDINEVNTNGIHFFNTIDAAYYYNFKCPPDFTGELKEFDQLGTYLESTFYLNGIKQQTETTTEATEE